MNPSRRLGLTALGLALLAPILCFSCSVFHGFGPCGPANLAGLLGCGGVLVCLPLAFGFGIAALMKSGQNARASFHQRERDRFWRRVRGRDDD